MSILIAKLACGGSLALDFHTFFNCFFQSNFLKLSFEVFDLIFFFRVRVAFVLHIEHWLHYAGSLDRSNVFLVVVGDLPSRIILHNVELKLNLFVKTDVAVVDKSSDKIKFTLSAESLSKFEFFLVKGLLLDLLWWDKSAFGVFLASEDHMVAENCFVLCHIS